MKSSKIILFLVLLLVASSIEQAFANDINVGPDGVYSTIQNGYNNAGNGDTIQVQSGTYLETLDFNRSVSVGLIGGYNSSFRTNLSDSAVTGSLTISSGTVTVENIVITPPTNVMLLTVNGSTCDANLISEAGGYVNDPCVSITVCTPGTSNCVNINSILFDTGSFGLRIFKQALGSVPLTQVTSGSGSLAECVQYADNTSDWGPVEMASVILGNEPAVEVPIQVIDSSFSAIPGSCGPPEYTPDTSPQFDGFNGILGVGPFIYDCGTACVSPASNPGLYYTCSGSNCSITTVPLTNQVRNPVASLPTDNNGVIVQLPDVAAGGAASLNGSVVLGIGTQLNNSLSGVNVYSLDSNGNFITTFDGVTYMDTLNSANGSFIDTGSNGLFFPSTSLTTDCSCPTDSEPGCGWFCPSSILSLSASITGAFGSPTATVQFQIGNYDTLTNSTNNSTNNVFSDIGGDNNTFDWGLPFYFGHDVYIGFENRSNLGTGQYFAY